MNLTGKPLVFVQYIYDIKFQEKSFKNIIECNQKDRVSRQSVGNLLCPRFQICILGMDELVSFMKLCNISFLQEKLHCSM